MRAKHAEFCPSVRVVEPTCCAVCCLVSPPMLRRVMPRCAMLCTIVHTYTGSRWVPVKRGAAPYGLLVLKDSTPDEPGEGGLGLVCGLAFALCGCVMGDKLVQYP